MRHASNGLATDVQLARQNFFEGKRIPPGAVSDLIAKSWQRASSAGMRPEDQALFSTAVSRTQLQLIEDEHRVLIDACGEDMEILARAFPAQHWLVFCTNADGMIVSSNASARAGIGPAAAAVLRGGKRVCESSLGTNAPACVLIEGGGAVQIRRGEHYLNELVDVVCAAAPIYDCHDRLIGVIDITGFGVDLPSYALSLVQSAAMSIENRLYARLHGCRILHLHHDHRMLHTPAEGIVAISGDDVIAAANRAARQMLKLRGAGGTGTELRQVFASGLHGTAASSHGSLSALGGERFFVSLDQPAAPTRGRQQHGGDGGKPADNGSCVIADAALSRAVEKAVTVIREQVPVILLGETGTGKSMLARALHEASRPGEAFVSLNCSAIPESLAEAELFGYADGAFTGSRKGGSAGKIEQADHGTLFLDEIGDMPLALQTRLLSVLQERSLTRIGSSKPVPRPGSRGHLPGGLVLPPERPVGAHAGPARAHGHARAGGVRPAVARARAVQAARRRCHGPGHVAPLAWQRTRTPPGAARSHCLVRRQRNRAARAFRRLLGGDSDRHTGAGGAASPWPIHRHGGCAERTDPQDPGSAQWQSLAGCARAGHLARHPVSQAGAPQPRLIAPGLAPSRPPMIAWRLSGAFSFSPMSQLCRDTGAV
ncbi:helix-turn-helix, Fis-type [Cupriavidus basilensis OR16]|uniref:Helix-turn-helix, Fis-type n=1 Tax=Cupriavidus basilensis OR16 TaxID=1127483 RepID=H1SC83_9BURK|nr:helix-turn-helix, Fis-type [Cupriavidus basilensis OR16]